MYDLIIRNGTIYDGCGGEPFAGDIAVNGDKIVAVEKTGTIKEVGKEEVDATGRIVTPGFVDIHTHYDGQVTWDPYLSPSCYHGVTTVVMGNCGVGFAPCKPEDHDRLIELMEGIEDIPGTALHEGMDWTWETFPEFLDALDNKLLALDVGTQVPHTALRRYVMGERCSAEEDATSQDIAAMKVIVKEAIEAGALGFSTSRTEKHRASTGELTPAIEAREDELTGIAQAVGETGTGVLQGISDFYDFEREFNLFKTMVKASGRPVSITVEQQDARPDWWKQLLDGVTEAQQEGLAMYGQVPPRATGVLMGLTCTLNPFFLHPSFMEIYDLPLEEKVTRMHDRLFRRKLIEEEPTELDVPILKEIIYSYDKMFFLQDPIDYEPSSENSVAAIAEANGCSPFEVIYDMLLEDDGYALIYHPLFNYMPGNLDYVEDMMKHPFTVMGLSDGGAHCGALCDASFPTTVIQHWGRDRSRGNKFPLQELIKKQTKDTSEQVGLLDRGVLKPGYKADINVIDFENLTLHVPRVVHDLPAGGRRLMQKASGYETTVISGKVAFKNGEPTGELNGKVIRGEQPAPRMV